MRVILLLLCAALSGGCPKGRANTERSAGARGAVSAEASSAPKVRSDVVVFEGACDASGAVPVDSRSFAVADDEDNVIRVFDAERGGAPIASIDVSSALLVKFKKKPKEADFEAATRLGDAALWLTSHARSKKGKAKEERLRFFMSEVPGRNSKALPGAVYTELLADMLADDRLRALGLADAAFKPPQAEGGLNLEGMTAMPDGRVLLGFRNPQPGGKTLLVPLQNPLEPFQGKRARFGDPILLDVQGLGVRGLSYWHDSYLIAAGPVGDGGPIRLYRWHGPDHAPREIAGVARLGLNIEAFFTPEERDDIMILSDDGAREIDGARCKDLEDPRRKRFRGHWLSMTGER